MNMVWTIWNYFEVACVGGQFMDLPVSTIRSIDQCLSMSDAALHYGCEIGNSITHNSRFPNPLFHLIRSAEIPPQELETALRHLCNIGYDIEERDSGGATLFLFGATQLCPSGIRFLKFLIEKGADLHAVDTDNCGALHYALEPPDAWAAWDSSCTGACDHTSSGHDEWGWEVFGTESESCAEDYCDEDLTLAPSAIDEIQTDRLACDDEVHERFYREDIGEKNPGDEDDEDDEEALEIPEGYILCNDDAGDAYIIRKPLSVLKTRLRFKLLTLLRAGCDPNVFDKYGHSLSDDARYHGLWPEWTWALLNAGYVFDEDSDRWVKRVEDEVSSGQ